MQLWFDSKREEEDSAADAWKGTLREKLRISDETAAELLASKFCLLSINLSATMSEEAINYALHHYM